MQLKWYLNKIKLYFTKMPHLLSNPLPIHFKKIIIPIPSIYPYIFSSNA